MCFFLSPSIYFILCSLPPAWIFFCPFFSFPVIYKITSVMDFVLRQEKLLLNNEDLFVLNLAGKKDPWVRPKIQLF